jgi:signal transduction histidine kinase/DNA-binding response OmpR family regulator
LRAGLFPLLLLLQGTLCAQSTTFEPRRADSLTNLLKSSTGIERAIQLKDLAKIYPRRNLDSSIMLFEEALAICRDLRNDTTAMLLLADYPASLSHAGEQELARHYLVMGRNMTSEDAQLPRYRVQIYSALFDLHYWFFTDYDSCIYYTKKWIDIAPDSNWMANGYIELAASYGRKGDNITALENYNIAQDYLQSSNADLWIQSALANNLGMLYSEERELKKAEEYFLKALELAQASKRPGHDLAELNNLGVLYQWMGEYDKSLKYLAMAAERLPIRNDPWSEGNNILNVGNTLTLSGNPVEGIAKYKQSMVIFAKLKDDYKVASLHHLMAEAYRLMGRYRDAEREALLSLEWDQKFGYGDLVKETYEELYKIYGAMRQYDKAFDYQTRFLAIVDSLNSAERRTKFGLLEKNYEIAQQEKVREKLERENELHIAQARADNVTQIGLTAGTIVLAIGVVVSVAAYRRSRAQKQKIEELAQQLQEAANTKSRFFANVSHELRTPLTLIHGMLELMKDGSQGGGEKMDIALDNSRRVQSMLNDVLDLSRLEGGKWELSPKRKEILPLLSRIVLAFESLLVRKNIRLQFDANELQGVVMDLDEDKFEKVINNLMYNAIKFNRDGGWIKVNATRNNGSVDIQVEDSGVGIPEKDLPHIFDRFYQSSATDKLNAQGIGVGLSLVRELTMLHGGNVSVKSRLNEGSAFTVHFPVSADTTPPEPEEEIAETADVTFDSFHRKPVILIVEDNDEMRYYLKEILGDDVAIAEARHGREGLNWLKAHRPDLIISDVMMPEMDGYEFLTQLKNSPTYRIFPVVMLTARAAEEDLLQGLQLGVDDYIIKPFNARELRIRIHNLLVNQSMRNEWSQKPPEADEVVVGHVEDAELLEKIRTYVETNAQNSSLGIADLADHLAMSERQVYRKAATTTGMTPGQLIKEIRLKIAYRLLLERKVVKVAELARRVGFENSSYFSRQFLERYGKRPADLL